MKRASDAGPAEDAAAKRYVKLTPLEHVRARPGMYVGNTSVTTASALALVDGRVAAREFAHVSALFTVIGEIVANAFDAAVADPAVTAIDVVVGDRAICVSNNGRGIPILVHAEHQVYIPTLIFGHLLSGSNYGEDRDGVGQNGLGGKLANIFSTRFEVRVVDPERKLVFKQQWRDNMSVVGEPVIKPSSAAGVVEVLFEPEPSFLLPSAAISADVADCVRKRCADLAVCSSARVTFQGEALPYGSFSAYAALFDEVLCVDDASPAWRVALLSGDGASVGLVNAQAADGRHIALTLSALAAAVIAAAPAKKRGVATPAALAKRLRVVVVVRVKNATFDSQTKSRCVSFEAPAWVPSKKLVRAALPLLAQLVEDSTAKETKAMNRKTDGRKTAKVDVEKLRDAVLAGTAKSRECTLFLSEGDSAASWVIAGIGAIGNDRFGVFPLRGKLLNVRDASAKKV